MRLGPHLPCAGGEHKICPSRLPLTFNSPKRIVVIHSPPRVEKLCLLFVFLLSPIESLNGHARSRPLSGRKKSAKERVKSTELVIAQINGAAPIWAPPYNGRVNLFIKTITREH